MRQRGYDEDLTRSAAMKAYERILRRGIHQFKFQSQFRTYCWSIVVREAQRLFKPEPVSEELDEDAAAATPLVENDPAPDPDLILKLIRPCLDLLNGREWDVLRLFYLEQRSPEQISKAMEITRNYVNILNFRARGKVKDCLKKRGYLSEEDLYTPL